MMFDYLTFEDFKQIRRSRVEMPRAAKRLGLDAQTIHAIQWTQVSYGKLMNDLYPSGLLVRLDEPMKHDFKHAKAPEPGETGVAKDFYSERVWSVSWEGGSNFNLMADKDQFTVLGIFAATDSQVP